MTRMPLIIMLAATAALAGCNKESHTIVAGSPDTGESNSAKNAAVQLPPSIVATKLYRCADNSVVTVDYLSDNKSANVHVGQGAATQVTSPEPGKPMSAAGGYSVDGGPTSSSAKIAVPGHPAQSCNT
jgi:hypothetical protein